jgi:hypothetical protein
MDSRNLQALVLSIIKLFVSKLTPYESEKLECEHFQVMSAGERPTLLAQDQDSDHFLETKNKIKTLRSSSRRFKTSLFLMRNLTSNREAIE